MVIYISASHYLRTSDLQSTTALWLRPLFVSVWFLQTSRFVLFRLKNKIYSAWSYAECVTFVLRCVYMSCVLFVTQSTGWEVGGLTVPAWPCSPLFFLILFSIQIFIFLFSSPVHQPWTFCPSLHSHIQSINTCRQYILSACCLSSDTYLPLTEQQQELGFFLNQSQCWHCMGATARDTNDKHLRECITRTNHTRPPSPTLIPHLSSGASTRTHSSTGSARCQGPTRPQPQGSISVLFLKCPLVSLSLCSHTPVEPQGGAVKSDWLDQTRSP